MKKWMTGMMTILLLAALALPVSAASHTVVKGDSMWTVSYTHLDVYKRQPPAAARVRAEKEIETGELNR